MRGLSSILRTRMMTVMARFSYTNNYSTSQFPQKQPFENGSLFTVTYSSHMASQSFCEIIASYDPLIDLLCVSYALDICTASS
jgi:hypothetical protein